MAALCTVLPFQSSQHVFFYKCGYHTVACSSVGLMDDVIFIIPYQCMKRLFSCLLRGHRCSLYFHMVIVYHIHPSASADVTIYR